MKEIKNNIVAVFSIAGVGRFIRETFYNYNFKPMGRWDITDTNSMKKLGLLVAFVAIGLFAYADAPYRGQNCSWEDGNFNGSSSTRVADHESESVKGVNSDTRYLYKHNGNIRYDASGNPNCVDGVGNERKGGYSY